MGIRRKRRGLRHHSPVPPPGRVIDKTIYRRGPEKARVRRQVREDL